MKIFSPVPRKRGRIEIIPLIDIMFFLLAAFMVVSIHKIKVKMLKVSLPTDVPVSQLEAKEDFITVSVDAGGHIALDKQPVTDGAGLLPALQQLYARNKDQKFLIAADRDSRNGDVIAILGKLRTAGFQKVAFNLKSGSLPTPGAPGTPETPAPAAPPEPASPPAAPPAPSATAPAAPPTPAAVPAPPSPPPAPAEPATPKT
jgi:biopolymer transport protein ExbD